jgi:predicted permease
VNREDDLDRELRDHLELEAEERAAADLPSGRAQAEARRQFGSIVRPKEDVRDAWGWTWLERLEQDLGFAARLLLKHPGFSVTAILTLAFGIGAATTIFGQLNALFWKPLPVSRPGELHMLAWWSRKPAFVAMPNVAPGPHLPSGDTYGTFSYPAYVAMRDGVRDSASLACWADLGETRPIVMRDVGFGTVHFVSGNYFEVLGASPAVGRLLTPDDDVPGTSAAVISYAFWQRTFGGDAAAVRRTVDLNGRSFSIVGVTRAGFFGVDPASAPDVLVPVNAIQLAAATTNPLQNPLIWAVCRVVARVPSGSSAERVRRDAAGWLQDAIRAKPPRNEYEPPRLWLVDASRGISSVRDAILTPVLLLFAAVVAVVLIACANIAGLLMVRSASRSREIATRLALGASRGRLIRQLLTESALLSAIGGGLGVALAYMLARWSPAFISRLMPTLYGSDRTVGLTAAPDGRVLLFALSTTVVTGVMFGTLPAAWATRIDLMAAIKSGTVGRRRTRWLGDRAMVAVQSAVTLVLVFGAGLLLQTVANLRATPLGFQPDRLLYAKVEPRTGGIPNDRRGQYFLDAIGRVAAIPGVVSASATDAPPLGARAAIFMNGGISLPVCIPGLTTGAPDEATTTLGGVAPRFFSTIGARMVAGREFEWQDLPRDWARLPSIAVVNDAFVRTFLAGKDPLQQRFVLGACTANANPSTILGVVADVKNGLRETVAPRVYVLLGPTGDPATLVMRSTMAPEQLIPTVRRALSEFNVSVPSFAETPATELREQQMRQERLLGDLLVVFGSVALALSAIGIYGMLGYLVVRRTRDIGVRMAIGASRRDVARLVLIEAVMPVGAGVFAGMLVSMVAARWLHSVIFGVSAYDARTLLAASSVIVTTALLAAAVPARRATTIDPLLALRVE